LHNVEVKTITLKGVDVLKKAPLPYFAKYFNSPLNSAEKFMKSEDAGELEVSERNSISLENLSYALSCNPIQFPNCPHAQPLFSKLENFTATTGCLLFYLPARHLSSSRRFWFTCITEFSSSGPGIEKLATAFTAGERAFVALESDASSFEKRPVPFAQSQIEWLLYAFSDAAAATVF
jgi:hypothetical protein